MSFSISGTSITLTRGDTLAAQIEITDPSGSLYQPVEGDVIRFAMKTSYNDDEPCLILKEIPHDSMKLIFEPEDTKNLAYGSYVYDVQITKVNGEVDTFIKGKLKLTEEVE